MSGGFDDTEGWSQDEASHIEEDAASREKDEVDILVESVSGEGWFLPTEETAPSKHTSPGDVGGGDPGERRKGKAGGGEAKRGRLGRK